MSNRKYKEKRWAKRKRVRLLCIYSGTLDFKVGKVYSAKLSFHDVLGRERYRARGDDSDYLFRLPLDGAVWGFRVV